MPQHKSAEAETFEITRLHHLRAKIFQALADPVRLGILDFLKAGEKCVCEIVAAFPRRQPTISKHLSTLYEVGILDKRVEGRSVYYRVRDQRIYEVIKVAEEITIKPLLEVAEKL
ncbi:MAG TPA: ArsR family transcriptional regulator [Candidatus Methanomethylia archaeon]|nr:winged helix-turn-helix transcriptional regulator [Candidatus Verstraetearchaeota archaeon]HDI46497.1 ArsR family transcriptional regulator [Candidatus Methanomethylicia archaeon]